MLQLDSISEFEWRRVVERLDMGVTESSRSYFLGDFPVSL